jgi:hypothetical protein
MTLLAQLQEVIVQLNFVSLMTIAMGIELCPFSGCMQLVKCSWLLCRHEAKSESVYTTSSGDSLGSTVALIVIPAVDCK